MGRHVEMYERLRGWCREHATQLLAAGVVLLFLQDVFGMHGLVAMRRSEKEMEQTRREIERLNLENRELEERVKALKTDPAAIERIAREEMGLAKPGELIFKLPPKPSDASSGNATESPTKKEQ